LRAEIIKGLGLDVRHWSTVSFLMAHPNIDERRETVGKVLSTGIRIGTPEAKVLSVVFNCSQSAIKADLKFLRSSADST
jgi:hypothetical protein